MEMLEDNHERNASVCMIIGDLDHFKRVNDIWGHQAGDEAISAFGKLVSQTVRATDLCGRIGGEEFCVLVCNCEQEAAVGMANRIRSKFAILELESLGPDIRLTASFGVSQWRPGEGYGKLFARADEALYQAKRSGRNRVVSSRFGVAGHPDETVPAPSTSAASVAPSGMDRATVVDLPPARPARREAK